MPQGAESKGRGEPPLSDVLLEALKGIRNEILLYGIAVIIIITGSARFGVEILQVLEVPLLIFATFVLGVYFILNIVGARGRVLRRE